MQSRRFLPRQLPVESIHAVYADSKPFRYAVIDDFYNVEDALALHKAFPRFSRLELRKARFFSGRVYGPPPDKGAPEIQTAFKELAAREFSSDISRLTGIEPLAMDSTLDGAGVHIGLRGSALPIHADHNTHPKATWLYRRLNLLVYLNPNWNPSWESNLLLYDEFGNRRVEIEPRFNRAVLMEVHDSAFHGYRPLKIPKLEMRQMLAAYYYSPEPSAKQSAEPHGTTFGNPTDLTYMDRLAMKVRRRIVHRFSRLAPTARWRD